MHAPVTNPTPCRYCGGPTLGWGKDRSGNARRFCKACKKSFGLIPERPLGTMRIPLEIATLCVSLLTEGSSVRSTERITGVHRDTICKLLRVAGAKCEDLMLRMVQEITVEDVQCDELWAPILMKEKTKARKKIQDPKIGDSYTWLAMERTSKLILTSHVGQRTSEDADLFMGQLADATTGRYQLSTDAFGAYPAAVERHLGGRVDYATVRKIFNEEGGNERRYSPPTIIGVEKKLISGNPVEERACTSHIERQNLDVRMRCRRFGRLVNAFSKKWENHQAAVCLWVAAQNFCHMNRTIRMTPAMAAGIVRKPWTVGMLLTA
jgi:IS1 family transposase/transposase-like protein